MDNSSSFEESVNPINPRLSRSQSLFDARRRFVFSEYFQIPGANIANWSRHLVQGWTLSSILTLQAGFPVRVSSTDDTELMNSLAYEPSGEPNQVAPFRRLSPQKSGGYFFDPSSFADAAIGQMGDSRRTVCCGPGIGNLDLGVLKTIPIREGTKLEFRAEFFNVLNHTQFLNPDGNITDGASFGQVSRARDPRIIQLAMKVIF